MITFTTASGKTYHILDRTGVHAMCRKSVQPGSYTSIAVGGYVTRRNTYRQHAQDSIRRISHSRPDCSKCVEKLDAALAASWAEAHEEHRQRALDATESGEPDWRSIFDALVPEGGPANLERIALAVRQDEVNQRVWDVASLIEEAVRVAARMALAQRGR